MIKHTVYFGIEKDREGNQINSINIRLNVIKNHLSENLQGFTWIDTIGYWEGVAEKSVALEIIGNINSYVIINIAKFIKETLDQHTILVTHQEITINSI